MCLVLPGVQQPNRPGLTVGGVIERIVVQSVTEFHSANREQNSLDRLTLGGRQIIEVWSPIAERFEER